MPSIDVVVARSLKDGLLYRVQSMVKRDFLIDAADKVVDVKTAFSSWDNCMKASFCKWPAIAVMVVGGLIILSVVWCLIRRLCCGLSCCCGCFQCLKCCVDCCGCCDAPNRHQNKKYLDEPYVPPQHGYQTQPAMQPPPSSNYRTPQYAEFDVPKKGGDDALPEMPSWDAGSSKKVPVEENEVEMDHLKKSPASYSAQTPLLPTTSTGLLAVDSRSPRGSPVNGPIGYDHGQVQHMQIAGPGGPSPGYSQQQNSGYGHYFAGSRDPSRLDPEQQQFRDPYTPVPASYGHSPSQGYAELRAEPTLPILHDQPPPRGLPTAYGMRRRGTGDSVPRMGGRPPYRTDPQTRNSPAPRQTPGPRSDHHQYFSSERASPAPVDTDYGPSGHGHLAYRAASDHENRSQSPRYPHSPSSVWPPQNHPTQAGIDSAPQSPITNNSGFDFASDYARPQNQHNRPIDPTQSATQESYPGYKAYQPA